MKKLLKRWFPLVTQAHHQELIRDAMINANEAEERAICIGRHLEASKRRYSAAVSDLIEARMYRDIGTRDYIVTVTLSQLLAQTDGSARELLMRELARKVNAVLDAAGVAR